MTHVAIAVGQRGQVDEPEPERGIIARAVAGDRHAARSLYDAHAPRISRLIQRLTGDPELAREFTQDTFVRAFGRLDRFRGEAALSTWLHRIALSVTSNGLRKIRRLHSREMPIDDLSAADERDGVTGRLDGGEGWLHAGGRASSGGIDPDLRSRLSEAIDDLPMVLRVTLVMHDLEGYTHAEIAEATSVAEGTSKSRLFDARARMRTALADFAKD